MKIRSAKAKGKNLERLIRDKLIERFSLTSDDIRCTVGSEGGSDIKLSKKALKLLPYNIECKSRATMSVYSWYEQCLNHKGKLEPLLIVKANRKKPLIIIDLEFFLDLIDRETKNVR